MPLCASRPRKAGSSLNVCPLQDGIHRQHVAVSSSGTYSLRAFCFAAAASMLCGPSVIHVRPTEDRVRPQISMTTSLNITASQMRFSHSCSKLQSLHDQGQSNSEGLLIARGCEPRCLALGTKTITHLRKSSRN